MRLVLPIIAAIVLTLALVLALLPQLQPGAPRGVLQCWQRTATNPVDWKLIGDQAKTIEACAGYIEAIRTEQLKTEELVGGYQGWYVVARPEGIYYTRNLKKFPVRALVRTSDGKLAPPGQVDACFEGRGPNPRKIADKLKLGSCVEALFDKLCLPADEARYGTWAGTTLRLLNGEVSQAGRGDAFVSTGVSQQAPNCALPIAD